MALVKKKSITISATRQAKVSLLNINPSLLGRNLENEEMVAGAELCAMPLFFFPPSFSRERDQTLTVLSYVVYLNDKCMGLSYLFG